MNLSRIFAIYELIKERLPNTYPKPKLAFYQDEQSMVISNSLKEDRDETVYAIVNPNTNVISLPLQIAIKHTKKNGESIIKYQKIHKMSDEDIAHSLLHECAHIYAGERYGYDSDQYNDESYCDRFAARWLKKLAKEKLL